MNLHQEVLTCTLGGPSIFIAFCACVAVLDDFSLLDLLLAREVLKAVLIIHTYIQHLYTKPENKTNKFVQ